MTSHKEGEHEADPRSSSLCAHIETKCEAVGIDLSDSCLTGYTHRITCVIQLVIKYHSLNKIYSQKSCQTPGGAGGPHGTLFEKHLLRDTNVSCYVQ